MSSESAATSGGTVSAANPAALSLRRFLWQRPEWWSIAICAAAWVAMLIHSGQGMSHEGHHAATFASELIGWMLMVAAMMLPLLAYSIRTAAFASLWARRNRAIAAFLFGYFVPWLAIGVAVAATLSALHWMQSDIAAASAFVIAAIWILTRTRRRALLACQRTRPVAPLGWRADRDCILFGGMTGIACVKTCWPLMLACAFTGHGLVAMAGGLLVGLYERRTYRPTLRVPLAGTLILAAYYLAMAILHRGVMPPM